MKLNIESRKLVTIVACLATPELFLLVDIAFVDLVVPLVAVQITTTTEPSGGISH